MKIAFHRVENSGFIKHWLAYCESANIEYKIVNSYASDIIQQVSDCDAFMWHHHHSNYKDVLFSKQLLYSLQMAGKNVFPDFNTTWHFDDKVGQKYLLEAIGAPLVPSYVFYSKQEALNWIEKSTFPKVFKLRGGASSTNVQLAHNKHEAIKFVKKAFRKGFSQYNWKESFKEATRKHTNGKATLRDVLRPLYYAVKKYPPPFAKFKGNEKGYAYFQDFIPENNYDIRIIVVGDKAFGIKRMTRENDFRASGSGLIFYNKEAIDERCVQIAFEVNRKVKAQSIAFDFVFDTSHDPLIVEISYGFSPEGYFDCTGYWDEQLNWHARPFNPYGWMIEDLIMEIK